MSKGTFITFEGIDGSGKSTQIQYLKDYFKENEIDAVFTRDPGGTQLGEELRSLILHSENEKISPEAEMMLYGACRAQLVNEIILPALSQGKVVVSDRFLDSSVAYQGYGRKLGDEAVLNVNRQIIGECVPDITFFMDIDPTAVKVRLSGRSRDRIEGEGDGFMNDVFRGYLELYRKNADRIIKIDADKPEDVIRAEIIEIIERIRNFNSRESAASIPEVKR
jgi:dTMP kinase